MRYSVLAAALVGSAAAAYVPGPSTVTSTAHATITSCPPDVPSCPGTSAPSSPVKPVSTKASEYTTSTVYSTNLVTVTKCPPTVPDCPAAAKTPVVSTVVVAVSTTVCPVGPTSVPVKPVHPPASSPVKPVPPPASSPVKPVIPISPSYCATYTETCYVTVTAPGPKGTAPPYTPTYKPTGGAAPYPSGPATYSYSTGSPVKPSSPVQFTGGASQIQVGALAGAGVLAALLL